MSTIQSLNAKFYNKFLTKWKKWYWFTVEHDTLVEAHSLPGGTMIPYNYEPQYAMRATYKKFPEPWI